MKKIILPLLIILMVGCKKNNKDLNDQPTAVVSTTELSFDTDANSKLMFQDGESIALLTADVRRYEIGKVLRVKAINETTIEVANFAPVDIDDATILITIEGSPKPIRLFKIKKIRAHAVQEIKYPFINGTTQFLDVDNATVDLSQYKTTGIAVTKVSFDFTGETPLILKLKKLAKLKWKIQYHDFDPKHDPNNNWKDYMDAKDVRRFTGLLINYAYLIQASETRTSFLAEPIIDNDGVTFLTTAQKEVAYQKLMDIPSFSCGVCVNANGLGGGATFGLADYVLHDYITKYGTTAVHEMGHKIGYNHSSTMTYSRDGKGSVEACRRVYDQMLKNNEFPIQKASYYKQSDL
jgi:hypothetical protein